VNVVVVIYRIIVMGWVRTLK